MGSCARWAATVLLVSLAAFTPNALAAGTAAAKPTLMRAASGNLEIGEQRELFSVPGIGALTASRANGAPSSSVRLVNTSNRTFTAMRLRSYDGSPAYYERFYVGPGELFFLGGQTSETTIDQASIVPTNAGGAGPSAALDATVTASGNFHVVARIVATRAPGYKPAFIRQAAARTPPGTGSETQAPLFDLPGIGELRATASGFAGFGGAVLRNTSGTDLEATLLEAPSDQYGTLGHLYVFGDGADQALASAQGVEAQWGSVYPGDRGAASPFAQLAIGKSASDSHASALSTRGGAGSKRAASRFASLDLSRGQKRKSLIQLPGVGKLMGGCGATNFGGGGIELENTSQRGFLATEIEGYADPLGRGARGSSTLMKPGESALFGSPEQDNSIHLVSVHPEDPNRAAPHYRLLLNIEGCDLWATATGAQG